MKKLIVIALLGLISCGPSREQIAKTTPKIIVVKYQFNNDSDTMTCQCNQLFIKDGELLCDWSVIASGVRSFKEIK